MCLLCERDGGERRERECGVCVCVVCIERERESVLCVERERERGVCVCV